jgi:hypothetical protein
MSMSVVDGITDSSNEWDVVDIIRGDEYTTGCREM